MPSRKETPEEKRRRLLAQVTAGAVDFQEQTRRPAPAPAPVVVAPPPPPPPQRQDEEPMEEPYTPPAEAENYSFEEPRPQRKSLTKRGWINGTHKYDPRMLKAAQDLADDLGIHFAELQNMALGLIVDPKARTSETEALLKRVRANFQ